MEVFFDELNKFYTLSNMPVASSQYWNNIYGWEPGEGHGRSGQKQIPMQSVTVKIVSET